MQTGLRGRDLIDLSDWTNEEIETALDVAFDLKRKRALGEPHPYLRDRVLSMLFFFSSTRTRASFEAGMAQLGGHAMASPSVTSPSARATSTSATSPRPAGCPCSTCSARSTTPSRRWPT
jgi:ornithine carbamoyltransferase